MLSKLSNKAHSLRETMRQTTAEITGVPYLCRKGRDNLDQLLESWLPDMGTYIEAGALDGFNFSNTYFLDRVKGWNGYLIEPNPPQFEACRKFRRRATVLNCALVPFSYSSKTIDLTYGADLSWVGDAYVGEELQQRKLLLKRYHLSGETVSVQARTLQSIIDEFRIQVDFLSLDVEGFEASVLRGVNLATSGPQVILAECHNAERVKDVCDALGSFYTSPKLLTHHDYIFKRL
jgi:FkbM family methyltransferase